MAEKELRRMSRTELIEIIYALQQNERALREENERLQARNDQLQAQLDDKLLRIEESGSIAEAALSLNHIFESADRAARQYLMSIHAANGTAEEILGEARREANAILAEARAKYPAPPEQEEKPESQDVP
ncbi:MAG: hypothetical protein LUG58_06085 [Clostridiales bacterium]|nr:hypothetical protein [Clostridiales bacterium]